MCKCDPILVEQARAVADDLIGKLTACLLSAHTARSHRKLWKHVDEVRDVLAALLVIRESFPSLDADIVDRVTAISESVPGCPHCQADVP